MLGKWKFVLPKLKIHACDFRCTARRPRPNISVLHNINQMHDIALNILIHSYSITPILAVILSKLFNLMLSVRYVSRGFKFSYIVSVPKPKDYYSNF